MPTPLNALTAILCGSLALGSLWAGDWPHLTCLATVALANALCVLDRYRTYRRSLALQTDWRQLQETLYQIKNLPESNHRAEERHP